ncbi:MAG: hypothetical protein MUC76_07125 [Spirochaetes bacterium]|nr:hypothetical protein [Spirochaetota bacterium]
MPCNKAIIMRTALLVILAVAAGPLHAASFSLGAQAGFVPSLGGNLHSSTHETIGVYNGIDGINKSLDGYDTSTINRLLGASGGIVLKATFYDYFLVRLGGNFTMDVRGGSGTTLYDTPAPGFTPELLDCTYSMYVIDAPLTAGLAVPFWKDVRIAFSCGAAFAYGNYKNSLRPESGGDVKGKFRGYGFPLVLLVEGDYFLNAKVSITASLAYYRGSTDIRKDRYRTDGDTDFARIDFTGYRFSMGASRHFYSR